MSKVLIIAEAGVNHNGSIDIAKKLVDEAVRIGVDIIKFQTFKAENLVTEDTPKADYQKQTSGKDESQFDMLKKLELTYDEFVELKNYCDNKQIEFLSTPFDLQSLLFLEDLGIKRWKVPSGEITNYPYLKKIASFQKPIILSTGMSTAEEVAEALGVLKSNGAKEIIVLHCTSEYPAPFSEVNLMAMKTMQKDFNVSIGYSDHTKGIEVPTAAVALGATVIEKHFTLNKEMDGPDHLSSLEPDEFESMVRAIRNIEKALGDGIKRPADSEIENRKVVRKSIVASCHIEKGEMFTENNLSTKRPGSGISPMKWNAVVGQMSKRRYEKDELIEWD